MLDPQFFPWCDSASPTSPLPWRELQPRLPLPWREGLGEGEKHTPGIVKLWESPGRAGGLPMINYSGTPAVYFGLPANRVVELGAQIQL